ncbi:MAG: MBL fold metallo-hydrolase [Acholeplasmataceae bacterium]|nr:MBL fold metallo-hydrolase [Acholeplasmataceae bacterium]
MKITFLGADRTLTGSCHMLEAHGKKILFDCGMFQGPKIIRSLNYRDFAFNPGEIDAVVLSHAHIDHSGLIPKLVKQGFSGRVHCTKVTRELCDILLPDSAHIQESEAEFANRKGKRAGKSNVEPMYTVDDAYEALKHFSVHDYNEDVELFSGITVRFRVAGHILGSAILNIFIEENGKKTKLIFTGDLGQPNQPILLDPYPMSGADFVITESTYGDRVHEVANREKELCDIIKDALTRGGNIIIPAFAVGRTQTMLYYFQKLMDSGELPRIPIMIDSPMAIKATQVMLLNPDEYDEEAQSIYDAQGGKLIDMPNVRYTQTPEESRAINEMPSPMIIISASGMADAGRVLHHLKHNLWRSDSSVIFAGFQAEGSMGRRLVEGVKRVKIMGEEIAVKAKIYNMTGFSAHADKDQMLTMFKNMKQKPSAFFIVHGEYDSASAFAETLRNTLGTATVIPNYGDSIIINGTDWKLETSPIITGVPEVEELRDYMRHMEKDYLLYKNKVEQTAVTDSAKIADMKKKLEKIRQYIDDAMKSM